MAPPLRLTPENALLLIIDPQEKLLPKVFQPDRVLKNTILLIRCARAVGLPLVATTQYEKGIGPLVAAVGQEIGKEAILDKVEFGCFDNPGFAAHMAQRHGARKVLLLTGIESHICVTQTALGAMERGYDVHVASDAVSSRTEWNWKTGLTRMQQAGAVISSTEMAVFEILKRSDTPHFKAILPELKEPVR